MSAIGSFLIYNYNFVSILNFTAIWMENTSRARLITRRAYTGSPGTAFDLWSPCRCSSAPRAKWS